MFDYKARLAYLLPLSPLCLIKMNNLKQSVILIDKFHGSPTPLLLFSRGRCVYVIIIRNFTGLYEVHTVWDESQ